MTTQLLFDFMETEEELNKYFDNILDLGDVIQILEEAELEPV